MPVHGRAESLRACLLALDRLDYQKADYEVIVVDDGSPNPIEPLFSSPPGNARFVRLPRRRGPARARNEGAAWARGAWLAFLDCDCIPNPAWLNKLEPHVAGGAVAGGRYLNGDGDHLFASASMALLEAVYAYYNGERGAARFFVTANLAVPASVFRELGGFDATFLTAEDRDFCARCAKRGVRLVYEPDAEVSHRSPVGFLGFWRRHYAYGQGAFRYWTRHPAQRDGASRRFESAKFYRELLTYCWRKQPGARALILSVLIGVSQTASALGFLAQALRPSRPQEFSGRSK